MKSIQSKILFVVIAGLLVITAVVSTIGVTMTHQVMHRDADRILTNAAQREAAQINAVLGDVVKSCTIMKHYAINEVGSANNLRNEAFRDQYQKKLEIMFNEVALNTSGVAGYFVRFDPKYTSGTSGFYKRVHDDKTVEDMPLTDLTKYDPNDKKNVGWYYEAVNAGQGVWMEPYYFPGIPIRIFSFAEPLYVNKVLIGVLGFDMNFSYLCSRIEAISVYDSGYAILLANDGVTPYTHAGPHEDGAASRSHSHNPHSEALIVLKNGMYLGMQADYADIQRDIRPMLHRIVIAFLLVLVFAIIYTVIMTRKIVAPLKQLTAAAQAFSDGNYDADLSDIPVDTKDEIGTLSRVLSGTYSKIQEYTAYINTLAYRDSLTGIKNTTAYTEATRDLNREICTGKPKFGVLVADINNLKETNDRFGHDVGNELIVHTSKILTAIFKSSVVFRIGGDEFAVILLDDDYKQYHSLIGQMDEVCASDYITTGDATVPISVARGVAIFDPAIDQVYDDVFAKADHEMYIHKRERKSEQ